MSELLKLETPELSGIEKSKAQQIKTTFEPMVKMLEGFEKSYNDLLKESEKGIDQEITTKAKRLRIDIGKVRIQTGKVKDEQKAEYLRAGNAIQGVHNIIVWAVTDKENKLKEIENYFEIQEQKRLEKLQADRVEMLSPYVEDAHERNLASMEEDVWKPYFAAKKKEHEDRLAAEKKAEQERIAQEKSEALERERIRKENERLKKEAEKREQEESKIKDQKEAEINDRRESASKFLLNIGFKKDPHGFTAQGYQHFIGSNHLMFETDRELDLFMNEVEETKDREERRLARESEARKEREQFEAKLKAEREERERVQKQLREKEEAERKAKEAEESRIEAEKNKGDAEKVKALIQDLGNLTAKYEFKSKANKKMYIEVCQLIDKIIKHIQK